MKLALIIWCAAIPCALADPLPIPFHEAFDRARLDTAWKVDVSGDNHISITHGALEINAAANTYAHLQRSLGVDLVRAACVLKPQGGISWVCSLFLYWDQRNWCQVSVLESEPSYYAVELIDGRLHEYRVPLAGKTNWYHVALELGVDCVRYQSSPDGRSWTSWRVAERPENWMRKPPALLILGKGFSRDDGEPRYLAADLNNDYAERGPRTLSRFREVEVERTPESELRLTSSEQAQLAKVGRDTLGELELAADSDPSFSSVSRHFPPMKHPRESLGIKDGPQEFAVLPDGALNFSGVTARFKIGAPPRPFSESECAKRLWDGHLPIVVATYQRDGLKFEQTVLGWSREFSPDTPLAAQVRFKIENPNNESQRVAIEFSVSTNVIHWDFETKAQGQDYVYLNVPFVKPAEAQPISQVEFNQRFVETRAAWEHLLAKGIDIKVPEERVNQAWRAWLAYNFINVDKRGNVFEPHDGGGGFYEEVYGYSAARYCYVLDLLGFHGEAQLYLDSILTFMSPEGLLVVNYGLPDTGAQLWAMGQHFHLTQDSQWLRRVAPAMIKMCDWIIAARRSSIAQQASDVPWHGLIKYRPYCDEPTPAYSYHTDTYLCLGMQAAAAALTAIDQTEAAARITKESEAYRQDILVSMDRAVIERKGLKMLPMFPETHALLKRVDYTGADYYSLVASMVLETDLLPAGDHRARWITDLLEQSHGLCLGTCAFQGGIDHAYTYGYWMNCLERDEIKRVILGFYATLAYGISRDTYAGVEVTALRTGENQATLPHLYSGTQQLLLLRNMLVWEQQDSLWLGRAIPRPWLEDGKAIRVANAPTLFGTAGYDIKSSQGARLMTVDLRPPTDRPPKHIYLRLRHPNQHAISKVTLDGAGYTDFTSDTVHLKPLKEHAVIQVRFD